MKRKIEIITTKNAKKIFAMLLVCTLALSSVAYAEPAEERSPDAVMLAKILYTEARGVESKMEQAAVVWCILNRADAYGRTIEKVIKARHQFAWRQSAPVLDDLYDLAQDVLLRWELEKLGVGSVGRVLPKDYLYFAGRNGHNWFRKNYKSRKHWDFSLPNPYEVEDDSI